MKNVINEAKGLMVAGIDPAAEIVRFKSFPYPWFLVELFKHAPQVRMLIVSREIRMQIEGKEPYKSIFEAHQTKIASSENFGKRRINFKMSSYKDRQAFMLALDEERRALFDELLEFNCIEAEVTSRYFCLEGEEYLPPLDIAKIFHCSQGGLQLWVGTILYYLDSPLDVPKQSMVRVSGLERYVECERARLRHVERLNNILASHGLTSVPKGMPIRFVENYALIYKAWTSDALSEFTISEGERAALVARYGLEDAMFKTLGEVGIAHNLTRERIRQLESSALDKLRELEKK